MKRSISFLTLAVSLLAGCEQPPVDPEPVGSTGPLFALTTQVRADSESSSYVVVTDKLEQDGTLSLDNAIEVPGRALGFGIPKSGALYVGTSDGATVTRYELTSAGALEKGKSVSFESKGVKEIGEYQNQMQFVSATKAYYFDTRTSQAIVWNPTAMEVTGTINLGELTVEGAALSFSSFPIRRDNQIIMLAAWRSPSTASVPDITKLAGVVSIDTRTDVATVRKDDRCGYVRDGVMGADGQLYLATEAYAAALHRVAGSRVPAPCMLRFNPQTLAFDPSFFVELNTLAGGSTGGSLVPGPGGAVYLRVLDESLSPVTATTNARALASAPAWRWSQVQLGNTPTATPVAALPPGTGSTFLFEAGDQTLFTTFTNSSSATDLHVLTGQSGKKTTSLQGITFSFLQVR